MVLSELKYLSGKFEIGGKFFFNPPGANLEERFYYKCLF